jgi:hypothetical protein
MSDKITVKIKSGMTTSQYWYSIGGTFEVAESGSIWIVMDVGGAYHGRGIYKEHCDIVPDEPRLYEHEGVQYELPDWAKFVTCDGTSRSLFAWENKPETDQSERSCYFYTSEGKRDTLRKYVKPLPEGAFIEEL